MKGMVTMKILKDIREGLGLTKEELAWRLQVHAQTIGQWENQTKLSTRGICTYLNNLSLSDYHRRELEVMRKENWKYDENKSPMTNELARIRNGLGKTMVELSNILGHYDNYWAQIEHHGRPLSSRDFDMLDKVFHISSTTLKRHNIIVERVHDNRPIPEAYKVENPEIQEPEDLYDNQVQEIDSEACMELLREIEASNEGSILNASEEDPQVIKLRKLMGVIYYDEDEERQRISKKSLTM